MTRDRHNIQNNIQAWPSRDFGPPYNIHTMEETIFQIYGTFVLTLGGFVLPVLTVAISVFPEGIRQLREGYENEQKQADKNLQEEIEKQKVKNEVDYDVLQKNIKALKSTKSRAQRRLKYLDPKYIAYQSGAAIGISLATLLIAISLADYIIILPAFLMTVSIGCLVWSLYVFSNSISIIIEASSAVQTIQRTNQEKILELLTEIADNSKNGNDSLFIDPKKIEVIFNNEKIVDGKEYIFSTNNKHSIKIAFKNLSEYMLKTAELGFTFPAEFLVEGGAISSTYTGDTQKIIRFKYQYMQANVNQIVGTIDMTFLKTGTFDVDTFFKGENLKNKNIKFKIRVVP